MADPSDFQILVIMDSRGREIDSELSALDLRVNVRPYSGLGSVAAVKRAMSDSYGTNYDIITLATGICDITMVNSYGRGDRYILRKKTVEESLTYFKTQLEAAYKLAKNHFYNSKIHVATLVGLDLLDYNTPNLKLLSEDERRERQTTKTPHQSQDHLNSTIYEANHLIAQLNIDNDVPTPWTSNAVHRWYGGKHHNAYNLLSDGCHFNAKLRAAWAKKLYLSYKKFKQIR